MKKQKSLSKLKKEAWNLFSLVVKLSYSENGTEVNCFTCGANLTIGTSNCQAGHCFPKSAYPSLYFDKDNVRPQCYRCNIHLSGNTHIFIENLIKEIGQEKYDELNSRRHKEVKKTKTDYEDMINMLKIQLENLKQLK